MKQLFLKPMLLLSLALLPATTYSQGLQRYTNSLFAEYGLMRYNNEGNEWLGENARVLSAGLGYYKDLSGLVALGFKAKHYAVSGPANAAYNANTIQLQFRLQRPRISRTFRLRRFSPYVEAGFGHATEYFGQKADEYNAVYAFAALAAGADYSFSDHWSLGLQGEYRVSGKDAATVLADLRQALNPFNTISARLNFYFGRNRNRPAVPRIYTRLIAPLYTDSMGRRPVDPLLRELQAASPAAIPAATVFPPQVSKVTIKDTVLMRIVHADGEGSSLSPGIPEPVPNGRDTRVSHDTSILLKASPVLSQDTMAVIQQMAARTDSSIATLQQDAVFREDSSAVIAKIIAPPQQSDTALPQPVREKKDTMLSADTNVRSNPGAATVPAGSSQVRAERDTLWRTKRDTVTLYRRDTLTLFRTDTVTQLKRDTLIVKDTAQEQIDSLYHRQHAQQSERVPEDDGARSRSDTMSNNIRSGERRRQEHTDAGTQATGAPGRMRKTQVDPPETERQPDQRLKQLEAENEQLKNRLRESEAGSRNPATEKELTAKQAPVPDPPVRLPVLTPAGSGKNSTSLVVLPVGTGGGKKNNSEGLSKEQHRMAERQDSILQQLSLVQAKLAQLQALQIDTVATAGDSIGIKDSLAAPDTLPRLPVIKPHADSVQQALQRQIRQLNKENEALQQMVGTLNSLTPKEEEQGKDQTQLAAYDVFFNVNQSRPDTLALRKLLAFSDTLRTSGAYWILLEGFTDKSGNAAYNLQLSKKRVAAVKAVLVEQGIPKESILEKTFGSRFSTGLSNSNDRKVRITQVLR